MEKILCVDDYQTFLGLYREELSEEGYEVIVAKDLAEAMEKLDKENPSLVVMEVLRPVENSILIVTLSKGRQVPVIFNTTTPQYCQEIMNWGIGACMNKSSDLTDLREKIREILDAKKKEEERRMRILRVGEGDETKL